MKTQKALWVVVVDRDGLLEKRYAGPKKANARAAVADALNDDKLKSDHVMVFRVSRVFTLTKEDLKTVLPRESF